MGKTPAEPEPGAGEGGEEAYGGGRVCADQDRGITAVASSGGLRAGKASSENLAARSFDTVLGLRPSAPTSFSTVSVRR